MGDYRELLAWKCAHALTLEIYRETKSFPSDERFGLTSQVRRASASVPANIAEGNGRGSRKEYLQFLMIARGSLNETRYFLDLAADLEYLSREAQSRLESSLARVAQLLAGLIRALKAK